MNGIAMPSAMRWGAAAFAGTCVLFAVALASGSGRDELTLVAGLGWAAGLIAVRPIVSQEKRSALYFAFAVLAFLILFLHETYAYTGATAAFPLIVGYTGIVLSVLDIVSITDTTVARIIARSLGATDTATAQGSSRIGRELIAVASMIGGVAGIYVFGFLLFTPIFAFLWMLLWGRKRSLPALYGAVFAFAFIYLLFDIGFGYDLYPGFVVPWLQGAD